jgi:pimeloyl-ACP methyl ester carboxylesterase
MRFVAELAQARVLPVEVAVVLWFTIAWRLAWVIWSRTVGRWGQRWVRWGRWQRRRGGRVPVRVRLIPWGRAGLTATIFFPIFFTMVATHRFKLGDGNDPQRTYQMAFDGVRIPTADGLTLDAWFIPQDGAERTILICHGAGANKGNFIWFITALRDQGYNIVFFDFRAHGGSDGRTTTYGLREKADVRAAVDWLKRERPAQARVIVGLGSSQGAMALALAAAEDPRIDAVILDSPFVSPYELLQGHARRIPLVGPVVVDWLLALASAQTGTNFFAASAEEAVAKIGDRPVLVIHGDKDFMMPLAHSERLYAAATGPRELWAGPGMHSNIVTEDPVAYREHVFGFLSRSLFAPVDKGTKERNEK